MRKLILILALAQKCFGLTHSEINLWQGSYNLIDYDTIENQFEIQRFYSSRSVYRGWFGFGWCSELEYKLILSNKNKPFIALCSRPVAEVILGKNQIFIWKNHNSEYEFDSLGRLIKFSKNEVCHIDYLEDDLPSQITCAQTRLKITFNRESRLIERLTSEQASLFYTYQNLNLTQVTINDSKRLYIYNQFHNLTQVRSRDFNEDIQYDDQQDTVIAIQDRETCLNKIFYKENPHLALVNVRRLCPNQQPFSGVWKFNSSGTLTAKPRQQPASYSSSSLY